MIIMTRQCVACKNHIARSDVKVTVHTKILCICFSDSWLFPAHNFVMHGLSSKLSGVSNNDSKAICRVQKE